MRFEVLHVTDCPHVPVLVERIREVDPDAEVSLICVTTDAQASELGMVGSPTLLLDGRRVGAAAEGAASLSCRMLVPTVAELRDRIDSERGAPGR